MKYISLVFDEDVHRNDVDELKTVRGCIGVSSYQNTVNMYFKHLDRVALLSLATALQHQLARGGSAISLVGQSLDECSTIREIYGCLREELAI